MVQAMYPLISYNVGGRNYPHIKSLLHVAMKYSFIIGLGVYLAIFIFKDIIIGFFTNGNTELTDMTRDAVTFMTPAYLISFVNIIGSSFHTAIEMPLESAVIAVCKSLVFVLIPLTILPDLFESIRMDYKLGIWLSIPVGEIMCLSVTVPLMYLSTRRLMRALT